MSEELKCTVCGAGPFQDRRGMTGHERIVHGVRKEPTAPASPVSRHAMPASLEVTIGSLLERVQALEHDNALFKSAGVDGDAAAACLQESELRKKAEQRTHELEGMVKELEARAQQAEAELEELRNMHPVLSEAYLTGQYANCPNCRAGLDAWLQAEVAKRGLVSAPPPPVAPTITELPDILPFLTDEREAWAKSHGFESWADAEKKVKSQRAAVAEPEEVPPWRR